MLRIAGIISPNAYQAADLKGSLLFKDPSKVASFRYQNLELFLGLQQNRSEPFSIATNDRKTLRIVFDGRLLNASSLRTELEEKYGHHFKGDSDEEILIHAYEVWKEEFLQKIEGGFALALFDEKKEVLLLARDPLGQKPLYWTVQGNYWLFATEIKTLLATGLVPQTPSIEGLASYLFFGYVPQDYSIIQGVNKLLPGHFLKVNLKRQVSIAQYWSYSRFLEENSTLSFEEAEDRLQLYLEKAIAQALPSEGKFGAPLLGDLGSSALALFLAKKSIPLKGYSVFFDDQQLASLECAEKVASDLDIPQPAKRMIFPEDTFNALPKIVWHLDEPIADLFAIQTWYLAELAASDTSIFFTSAGWEELFGGAKRYCAKTQPLKPSISSWIAQAPPFLRDRLFIPLLGVLGKKTKFQVMRNLDPGQKEHARYLKESSLFEGRSRYKVSPLLAEAFDPEVFSRRFHRLNFIEEAHLPSLYYDAKLKLPDNDLFQHERLFSAHHLNLVNPFLNRDLVEFLAGLPDRIKLKDNHPASLLKHLSEQLFIASLPLEKETTFLDNWRNYPPFRTLFGSLVEGRLVEEGYISAKWIKQQLGYPYLIPSTFRQFWAILNLEVWFRLFIDNPIEAEPPSLPLQKFLKK